MKTNENKITEEAIHTAMAVAVVAAVIIMVAELIWSPQALAGMNTPEETMRESVIYIRIYFCGMIGNLIYNMGSGILRAMGDSKKPLYFLIISCLLNVVLDIFFVMVLGMGVEGVAIATILSQFASAGMVCASLAKLNEDYRLKWKEVRFHWWVLQKIIYIGLPAGLQSLMYSVSNVIIQVNVNNFGTGTVFITNDCVYICNQCNINTFGRNINEAVYKRCRGYGNWSYDDNRRRDLCA